MTPYETYKLYMALRFHFTQKNYDYFKYNGKTRVTKEKFDTRRDRFFFQKLSKKYDGVKLRDYIIANLIHGKTWIGAFLEDDAEENYIDFAKRKQAFTYLFSEELNKVFDFVEDPKKVFEVPNSQYPEILHAYLSKDISLETLTVLNDFICFFDTFDKKIGKDDIIWSEIRLHATKLRPFLKYDKAKIKAILKRKLINT